jgi:uncharacterized protein (DUF1684 family)
LIHRGLLCLGMTVMLMAASAYETEITKWRENRLERLKADDGWLSLAGLFWLHDGANTFGRDAGNEIVLPDGPAHAGTFEWRDSKVVVSMDGSRRELKPDSDDAATVGRLKLYIIKRGDRMGIRLKDPESEYRREFHGLEYFPIREEYRVVAKWVPEKHTIPILNVLGQTENDECPGHAEFRWNGQDLKLYPILEEPGAKELFYIFRDQTSGKETYPAGRFFYSDMPKDGHVILDFNKAYNPPCAFTPYATCPLPPPENRLPIRVEAGEKKYGHH